MAGWRQATARTIAQDQADAARARAAAGIAPGEQPPPGKGPLPPGPKQDPTRDDGYRVGKGNAIAALGAAFRLDVGAARGVPPPAGTRARNGYDQARKAAVDAVESVTMSDQEG